MAAEERITKLKALLARVTQRAAEPRVVAAPVAPAEEVVDVAADEVFESEIEELDMSSVEGEAEIAVDDADFDLVDTEVTIEGAEDEAPESAPRPASSIGEALGSVRQSYVDEPPLKTPPPESGRQEVTPVPPPPPVELEADLSGGPIGTPSAGPTVEQLGEVVELEGPPDASEPLELEAPPVVEPSPAPSPAAPSSAARPAPSPSPAAARPMATLAQRSPAASPPARTEGARATFERPAAPASAAPAFTGTVVSDTPKTFLELLDDSLSL